MRLPAGVRDWLPHELSRKRDVERACARCSGAGRIRKCRRPRSNGSTCSSSVLGEVLAAQTFRFSDRRANALALRPEMTTPIARLVTTRMREVPLPLRLSYVAPAYRYEEPQEGRMREFTQAGTELIGMGGVDADAECLFMAIEALEEVDLRDVHFDVNDANLVDGVLEGLGFEAEEAATAKGYIADRNLVALRTLGRPELVELDDAARDDRSARARRALLPHPALDRGGRTPRGAVGPARARSNWASG